MGQAERAQLGQAAHGRRGWPGGEAGVDIFPPANDRRAQKFPMRQVTAWWPETQKAPVPWGGRPLVRLHQRLLGNVQEERTGAAGRVPEGSGDAC